MRECRPDPGLPRQIYGARFASKKPAGTGRHRQSCPDQVQSSGATQGTGRAARSVGQNRGHLRTSGRSAFEPDRRPGGRTRGRGGQSAGSRRPRGQSIRPVRASAKHRRNDGRGQSRDCRRVAVGAVRYHRRRQRNHPVARRRGDGSPAYRRTDRRRRPHRAPARFGRDRARAGRQGIRLDRGDRQADQPARAECDHRGRPSRQRGKGLCRGRERGQEPRRGDATGDASDRRYRSRSRRPGRQPDRRKRRRLAAGQECRRRRRADPEHHRAGAERLHLGRPGDRWGRQGGHLEPRALRHGDRRTRQSRQRASICRRPSSRLPTIAWRGCSTFPKC